MKIYPSTLYEFDDYLRDDWHPDLWVHVECEAEMLASGRMRRRYLVLDKLDRRLQQIPVAESSHSSPLKPAAEPATASVPPVSQPELSSERGQGGMQGSGPSKPAASTTDRPRSLEGRPVDSSERGQPGAGGDASPPPAEPCSPGNHAGPVKHQIRNDVGGFYCLACGERVG